MRSRWEQARRRLAKAVAALIVTGAVADLVDRLFPRRRYDAVRRVRLLLGDPASRCGVEEVLRTALGDSTAQLAFLIAGSDRWVTEDGLDAHPDDTWLRVECGARSLVAISHHADPAVVDAVMSAASTELVNAGLRAAIAEQLQEARESRRRLARAQLDERRRIERDLHDGAQQRLLGAAAQLQAGLVNGDPARMRAALELGVLECRQAVVELRELAHGLGPSAIADGGLAVAIEQLPMRFPLHATVELHGHRYPPEVEATLWFVVCEAVVNAVKHARPSVVEVRLIESDGALRLSVEDDGSGGADRNGNGLRGLADRVEAIGGQLDVIDRNARGTRIEALVPCGL